MNSRTLWNDNWYFAKTELGVKWEDRQIWEDKMQPVDLPHDWLIYDTKNLYEDSIGWYQSSTIQNRAHQPEFPAVFPRSPCHAICGTADTRYPISRRTAVNPATVLLCVKSKTRH